MYFTSHIIKKAWAIRRKAALKYGVHILDIDWGECLKWAKEMTQCIIQAFIKATLQRAKVETPEGRVMEMECKSVPTTNGTTRRICKFIEMNGKRRKTVQTKELSQWDIIDYAEWLLMPEQANDINQRALF